MRTVEIPLSAVLGRKHKKPARKTKPQAAPIKRDLRVAMADCMIDMMNAVKKGKR